MRIGLAAALFALAIALGPGGGEAAEPPADLAHCVTKAEILRPVMAAMGAGFVADLHGEMEGILAINLLRFEARDVIGADLVVFRYPGSGYARVVAFRDGCHEREIWIDNLYLEALQQIGMEEGV